MNDKQYGCGKQLNPNGGDARCGQAPHAFGPAGTKQLCQSCQDKRRIDTLEQALKSKPLDVQVSALEFKPGTVVVLRLPQGTPATLACQVGEELQKHIPFGTQIFVLPSGEDIEALDEAQMRELGWVRANSAVQDIVAERQRQVTAEGWTPKHDDQYSNGAMADAAGCYALHAHDFSKNEIKDFVPAWWPWHAEWWKPTNPRRDLVKAGALILAEIERIDRAADKGGAE